MIELEAIEIAFLFLGGVCVGGFGQKLWHDRRAAVDAICPVCLGSTEDDGMWEVRGDG